ncbi:MAG TPA: glycoside hydrolase 100 family protein [Burkholderiales bacterium]|nr:glycoside hydrolase 100 family protein [Burkholderiales bacterium]
MTTDGALVRACREESLRLLRENLTAHGILAAAGTPRAARRGYDRIFGRDAAVCAIAMALAGDADLGNGACQSLLTMAAHQGGNGQIPKYVDPAKGSADFWYLGCIDSTLWWLIAVRIVARALPDRGLEARLAEPIREAIRWLQCQEHQQIFLLQQNEASDWADIMPRSGFVLYTNALWYYAKRLYELPGAEETRQHFNALFLPSSEHLPGYRRLRLLTHYARRGARNRELYLSFVNLSFWGEEGDVFGNLLAILLGLADSSRAGRILRAIEAAQAGAPHPVRTVCTPIRPADPQWRAYMGRHRQNLEYQYHNGGIWPMVGGFWVMALMAAGKAKQARQELQRLAQANAVNGWEFNEWFHGCTGQPLGMPRQSWNAALFLLALRALEQKVF